MFDAISANKPDEINAALDAGVDINIRGPSGYTPLFESVLKHRVHSVDLLLQARHERSALALRARAGFHATHRIPVWRTFRTSHLRILSTTVELRHASSHTFVHGVITDARSEVQT
jgi:ankyrin repeat protein